MKIGLLGGGQVGQALFKVLYSEKETILNILREPLEIKKILVRDLNKKREIPKDLLTTNPEEIILDPEIPIIVELMGGIEPAYSYIKKSIRREKGCGNSQ